MLAVGSSDPKTLPTTTEAYGDFLLLHQVGNHDPALPTGDRGWVVHGGVHDGVVLLAGSLLSGISEI